MPKKTDVVDVNVAVVDVQSKTLFDRVSDFLTSKDWHFTTYEDRQYFSFNLRLRKGTARIVVEPVEGNGWSRVLVLTTFSTYVPEQRRQAVAEAIAHKLRPYLWQS